MLRWDMCYPPNGKKKESPGLVRRGLTRRTSASRSKVSIVTLLSRGATLTATNLPSSPSSLETSSVWASHTLLKAPRPSARTSERDIDAFWGVSPVMTVPASSAAGVCTPGGSSSSRGEGVDSVGDSTSNSGGWK